ncbi:hypothetical protein F0P96_18100 [Hymenobacter busanensis]|uniref:Uncharacterized protein n=1 Tax=Hymenobacter busanensis TaxID=2607656 RepID=A0A7L4ZRR2_9BACT|nr:hypothetical protein [Hymenobacter busanensis]KAA9327149.1 hypothetical protein F0P96_18100 [Hymenobacter busanensis]QHJ05814.1 hypothetical protein GUY19_00295 [Hymenobacter busanensis]
MVYSVIITPRRLSRGWLMLVFGLLICLKAPPLAALCIGWAVALSFSYEGIEVDLSDRRYRHFTWLLGLAIGSWQPLPPVQRVVLKAHSDIITSSTGSRTNYTSERYQHLTLLLSVPDSIIGEVIREFGTGQNAQAIAVGQQLADVLQVPFVVMPDV